MNKDSDRVRYTKLPGRRRGFLFGSSVWLGPDHLLLVRSSRFREEYRRFYFRDIQAIVTAEAPRFHISTRSGVIGFVWGWVGLVLLGVDRVLNSGLIWIWWGVVAALVGVWLYFSAYRSCRCRVHTAVSSEALPSVYRTWTARRFLNKLQPHLEQAQGVLPDNWADAVEDRRIGTLPPGRVAIAGPPLPQAATPPPPPALVTRTGTSLLFVGILCLGGLAELTTLTAPANAARWILGGFVLLQLVVAVVVLVQSFAGRLRPAMRNLAIACLVSMGVWYYAVQLGTGFAIALQAGRSQQRPVLNPAQPIAVLDHPTSRGVAGGISLLLGMIGVILLARGERPTEAVSTDA